MTLEARQAALLCAALAGGLTAVACAGSKTSPNRFNPPSDRGLNRVSSSAETTSARPGRRQALLIANYDYDDDDADLINPKNDVELLGAVLRKLGFEAPVMLANLSQQEIRDALKSFVADLQPGDEIFFYYSGHGVALRDRDGQPQNYLLGKTFSARDEIEAVNSGDVLAVNEVVQRLEQSPAKVRVIVVDACRNQSFTRSWSRGALDQSGFVSIDAQKISSGTFLAFSARQGERALDGLAGIDNGPYAHSLAQHLPKANQDIRLVFGDVGGDVRRRTSNRQFPDYRDALDGRFYFNSSGIVNTAPLAVEIRPIRSTDRGRDRPRAEPGMVFVPGGTFLYGCNPKVDTECDADEWELSEGQLPPFLIDKTEVAVADFRACVESGACPDGTYKTSLSNRYCNYGDAARDDHPMNCVSWEGAEAYCRSVGKRLPTEQEWEKAARGSDGRKYPWGNRPAASCEQATFQTNGLGCGKASTGRVNSKQSGASSVDAVNMVGNVWEWTTGWYRRDESRAIRGGAWNSLARDNRVSARTSASPFDQDPSIGLRCVKSD